MLKIRKIFVLIILLIIANIFIGQDLSRFVSYQEKLNKLFPSQHITAIIQDDFGILFIGTGRGLYQFDGYRLESFEIKKYNKQEISNLYFSKEDHTIWIGIKGKGIVSYDKVMKKYTFYDSHTIAALKSNQINVIIKRNDELFFGTDSGLTSLNLKKHKWYYYDSLKTNRINAFAIDSQALRIGTDKGVYVFTDNRKLKLSINSLSFSF